MTPFPMSGPVCLLATFGGALCRGCVRRVAGMGEGGVFDLLGPDAQWTIVGNSVVTGTYHSRE
jgi:hypothetical protein